MLISNENKESIMRYAAEKAVIVIAAVIGLGMLGLSLVSMYNDFVGGKSLPYLLVDLAFFSFGTILAGGSLRLYKRLVMLSVVTESAFEDVVYTRLRPVLEEIAHGTVEINEVKTKLSNLEKRLEKMEEELTKPAEVVGVPAPEALALRKTAFYMRTVITSMFFFGAYLFLLNYSLPFEPYLYTLLYVLWWFFITKEFDLFNRIEAWVVLGIPVLLVPAGSIILRATIGLAPLMGLIFLTVVIYAYLYYLYARTLRVEESEKVAANGYRRENFLYAKVKDACRKIVGWMKG